ncbi:ankyrin-2 [Aspergillus udagawae]|uniref:Ankyrin-2 n=1 Tax=Aspergillus udagawae TaxID=91492 RepID=A0A8E0QND4_9EURO|nr:ankyrin-2 [Aspergillus udagawae]GIC88089.1 ankyrin-2 [Aspergillus udagawae]
MRLLLDKGADVNAQGGSYGRTPLHLAVEARSIPAVAQLLERGALTNKQDFGGATPLQLAARKRDYQNALLLLPRSIDSLCFVNASMWRILLPGSEPHLEMTNGKSMSIVKRTENDLKNRGYPLSHHVTELAARGDDFMGADIASRRIFILGNGALLSSSLTGPRCRWWRRVQRQAPVDQPWDQRRQEVNRVWRVQSSTAPSRAALIQIPKEDFFVECCFTTRAITLRTSENCKWPSLSDTSELDTRGFEKTYGILWIMTKRPNAKASESALESRTFFSTAEYAQLPPCATDLFAPLVQQLLEEWRQTFQTAESRLAMKRTELLRANGRNPCLIRDLLGDAQLWGLLERTYNRQITELVAFQDSYRSQSWTVLRENDSTSNEQANDDLESFQDEEFNLTSISEAQKSTSTNKSMKRLSWITFVFLPLMFIASIFGMNIDVLKSNPSWWLYIPFAAVTTLLTLAVWLTFKYNSNLEESIERGFNRLTRRQPQEDLENGQRLSVTPQRRTAMFSAFGKKRS